MHESGLHYWDPTSDVAKSQMQRRRISPSSKQLRTKRNYTPRQVKMAEVARAGLQNAGFPSERDFPLMVQNGHISNYPIQVGDLDRARHIHGKDVGLLKGKTKETATGNRKHRPSTKGHAKLTPGCILNSGLFFVNKIVFLATCSRRVCLTTVKHERLHECSPNSVRFLMPIEGVVLLLRRSMGMTNTPPYNLALTRCRVTKTNSGSKRRPCPGDRATDPGSQGALSGATTQPPFQQDPIDHHHIYRVERRANVEFLSPKERSERDYVSKDDHFWGKTGLEATPSATIRGI
jgi:hypothetical protein